MAERQIDWTVLSRIDVLRGVSPESVQDLLEKCPVKHLAAGDRLLTKGEPNRCMYFLLSGRLTIHLDPLGPLTVLESGSTVGELSVIDQQPMSTDVIATENCELVEIDQATFWSLAMISHVFTVNLLLTLASRLRANNSAVDETIRLREHFERVALFDALTGLRNRRWLDQNLPRMVERSQRGGGPLSLLVVDVDHFKKFNDTFGHAIGDLVLGQVAQVLTQSLRPNDVVARFGGEEFVVVLPDSGSEQARAVAERLRGKACRMRVRTADGTELPPVTISLGLAELADSQKAEQLFETADAALYRAKRSGRNKVEG